MADDLLQPPITAAPATLPSPPPPPPPPPPPAAATATATTALPSSSDNQPGPPLAPKRQRRPSVRLGEIGDPPSSYDSHQLRRPKHKFPKDNTSFSKASASAASVKARSLTNLVNGAGDYSHETLNPDENGANFDRRVANKAKRRRAVRSSWVSNSKAAAAAAADAAEEGEDSDEEVFRVLDHPDSESPVKENVNMSPAQSPDDGAFDLWNGHRRTTTGGDGVRTWLIELGLSRYAPVFEIHEVDEEVLPMLTLEDLKDMGINAVGSRRKMYTAIQKLRKSFSCVSWCSLALSRGVVAWMSK